MRSYPFYLLGLLILLSPARAVILSGSDGTQNTTAPADNPYWNNIGSLNQATVVYLGNSWVITAAHVGYGIVVLGGTTYYPVAGSNVQLSNTDSSPADLVIFKLNSPPALPSVPLATQTSGTETSLEMIGNGGIRNTGTSFWIVSGTTWTTTVSSRNANFAGYVYTPGAALLRWGTNNRSSPVQFQSDGLYNIEGYSTTFSGSLNAAQGVLGDSGGPVFAKVGAGMVLAGEILAISSFEGQPSNTVVYGTHLNSGQANGTLCADIASYSSQIQSVMNALYQVSTSSVPSAGGSATGAGTYSYASTATVTASASPGYSFASWTENGTTASLSASYALTVTASHSLIANFQPSTISTWKSGYFTTARLSDPAVSGDLANPSGDGICVLLDYALHLNPLKANSPSALPQVSGTGGYLTLTYSRNKWATDLTYAVEVSADLETWNSGSSYTSAPVILNDNGLTQTVQISDLIPIASGQRRFIRLRVSGP